MAHVAVGVAWFRHLCRALGADPVRPCTAPLSRVENACGVCNQRLKLEYSTLLSCFAVEFKLRRCEPADAFRHHIGQHAPGALRG